MTGSLEVPRTEPVVVGLVGSGYWAQTMHAPLHASPGPTRLGGIWGADAEQTAALAAVHGVRAFPSYEELLEECEAVDLAVPPAAQAPFAVQAITAGRAVMLEKPLSDTLAGARSVLDAVDEHGVPTIVVLTKRYHERTRSFVEAAQALRSQGPLQGAVGQYLHGGLLDDGFVASPASWRAHPFGILRDLGPHLLDLVDCAAGPVVAVRGETTGSGYTTVTTWHEDGGSGQLALSGRTRLAGVRTVLDVFSEHGSVGYTTAGMDHDEVWPTVRAEFAAAVRTGAPVTVDAHRAGYLSAILDAVERSVVDDRRTEVSPL